MAQIPYTSEIKSNKISQDLATRLYQFMRINKLIDNLSMLNGSKQNNEDLLELSAKLEKLYTGYFDDSLEKPEDIEDAKRIFKDEELMDVAEKIAFADSDEDKMAQMRIYTAKKMAQTVMNGTPYTEIDSGYADSTDLSLTGTLFIVLEKENRKIDSEDFANRIINGNLEPDEIPTAVNALQSAKQKVIQRLKADWQTYQDLRTENPNIKEYTEYFESVLSDNKEFNYKVYPETRNVLLCIREDFADKDNGSKPAFLKMMGCMLDCGQQQISSKSPHTAKIMKESNYKAFVDLIQKQYPENTENVINTMLEVDGNAKNIEQARRAAFEKKGKELYVKFLSAVLVIKKEAVEAEHQTRFNYQRYVDENVASYITDLKKGQNNIAGDLHLTDESKAKSVKDIIDDTAENQIISVHHKIPVAAAVPLYLEQNSNLHPASKTQEMYDQVAKICPQAVENRTPKDIAIIGFALNVFSEEMRKDNIAQIYQISDKEVREKKLQVLKNKDAIREIYQKYFPLDTDTKTNAKKTILRIVNDPGNHALPLSKPVHQDAEPNGNINLSKSDTRVMINVKNTSRLTKQTTVDKIDNATVLMAEYDAFHLKEIAKSLSPNYKAALEQYNPAIRDDKNNQQQHQNIVARVVFKMPETTFIQSMRELLNKAQRAAPIQYMKNAIGISK